MVWRIRESLMDDNLRGARWGRAGPERADSSEEEEGHVSLDEGCDEGAGVQTLQQDRDHPRQRVRYGDSKESRVTPTPISALSQIYMYAQNHADS
jgi:hypothetical protein